jgi:hypothetical protein
MQPAWVGSIPSNGPYGIPRTLGPHYALSLNPQFSTMATILTCALLKRASPRLLQPDHMILRRARL